MSAGQDSSRGIDWRVPSEGHRAHRRRRRVVPSDLLSVDSNDKIITDVF